MTRNKVVGAAIACVITALIVVGSLLFADAFDQAPEKRQGHVTAVNFLSYKQEVKQAQYTRPVVIYFFSREGNLPVPADELTILRDFAGEHPEAKVVSINVALPENIPLAILHGVLRTPQVVALFQGQRAIGQSGLPVDTYELTRLLELVQGP